ncbi:hypothetical protein Tco_0418372 [Tanacetum coccineum]
MSLSVISVAQYIESDIYGYMECRKLVSQFDGRTPCVGDTGCQPLLQPTSADDVNRHSIGNSGQYGGGVHVVHSDTFSNRHLGSVEFPGPLTNLALAIERDSSFATKETSIFLIVTIVDYMTLCDYKQLSMQTMVYKASIFTLFPESLASSNNLLVISKLRESLVVVENNGSLRASASITTAFADALAKNGMCQFNPVTYAWNVFQSCALSSSHATTHEQKNKTSIFVGHPRS